MTSCFIAQSFAQHGLLTVFKMAVTKKNKFPDWKFSQKLLKIDIDILELEQVLCQSKK